MRTEGVFSPETEADAVEAFESVGPAARTVVRETAKAMSFDREEYDERVTGEVVETARDALFASLLAVTVGDREEWEAWREDHPEYEVRENGSEQVDRVVWHASPAAGTAVAATFQSEEDAAVATLRRQAFGRIYRPLFDDDAGENDE
ncbi:MULTISPECIES: DUF5809 family protein [Halolamina]|uniref:Uncharacterized protein n=1 Tax=Halolamina pelagica TaxID=699431 RepID=A0A1I5UAN5_9EURY|nr:MULTISPECIES: DUF5809 family protein [Halolamina]NHX37201.1 hypothetical protein [Halolamina sp. R1-12]SFP92288.1 hypothetical protein SAMN05216277_11228 [Halolamina pelagica]